jgi:hypothetical protein
MMTAPATAATDYPADATCEVGWKTLVPLALPDGWDDAMLDGVADSNLRRVAGEMGVDLLGSGVRGYQAALVECDESEDPRGYREAREGETAWAYEIGWSAPAREKVSAPDAVTVEAVDAGDGSWVVAPFPGKVLVAIKHGLGTEDINVEATRADGSPIRLVSVMPVSPDEVEIVQVGGVAKVVITLAPEDDEDVDGEQAETAGEQE